MTLKISQFIADKNPATPCLIVDLDVVKQNYLTLKSSLPQAKIYYAVKANPAAPIITTLEKLGSYFDVASLGEVKSCISLGISANRLSFGNTIKPIHAIRESYKLGIRLFAFDSAEELEKIAIYAPGSKVYCRIMVVNDGADWPLSRKFGTTAEQAIHLLIDAQEKGLKPAGISFHVGSQQKTVKAYQHAITLAANIFKTLQNRNITLDFLNLGGGFPANYSDEVPSTEDFGKTISTTMKELFPKEPPHLFIEPGRSVVGNSGVVRSEVILVSQRDETGKNPRWVYLDIGRFGGLAETEGEAIRYRFETPYDNLTTGLVPCVLAGPTCDSADVMYEKNPVMLPPELKSGDKIIILATGAYVASYCSTGFNGFAPLNEYYL
ncbi:type III PLP-dependent enzyme [Aristophania vespae]|uniref:ornithine decarboxylase n=1 Tax=Aristophania vespae TaxID=2697033 RepID=A0A6P1NJX5_9PROT|nr:type III PLP-dependent enzyme [Aristophania vespae]QHI95161.1 type III PLP-dependent enzyme [Aristophania vespae]